MSLSSATPGDTSKYLAIIVVHFFLRLCHRRFRQRTRSFLDLHTKIYSRSCVAVVVAAVAVFIHGFASVNRGGLIFNDQQFCILLNKWYFRNDKVDVIPC